MEIVKFLITVFTFLGTIYFALRKLIRGKGELEIIKTALLSAKELVTEHLGDLKFLFKRKTLENITAVEFLFYNNSADAIDSGDIEDDTPITLATQKGSSILEHQLVSQSSNRIKPEIKRISTSSILIKFQWLPPNAGFRLKLFCSGDNPTVVSDGKIKNLPPLVEIAQLEYPNLLSLVERAVNSAVKTAKATTEILAFSTIFFGLFFLYQIFSWSERKEARIFPSPQIIADFNHLQLTLISGKVYPDTNQLVAHVRDTTQVDVLTSSNFEIKFSWQPNEFLRAMGDSLTRNGYKVNYVFPKQRKSNFSMIKTKFQNQDSLIIRDPKSGAEYPVQVITYLNPKRKESPANIMLVHLLFFILLYSIISLIAIVYRFDVLRCINKYHKVLSENEKKFLNQKNNNKFGYRNILKFFATEKSIITYFL